MTKAPKAPRPARRTTKKAAAAEPAPSPEAIAPDRAEHIDLAGACSRLATVKWRGRRILPIAIAGFDVREQQARREADTWENYLARFEALMDEPA